MSDLRRSTLALVTALALATAPTLVAAATVAATSRLGGRIFEPDRKTPAVGLTVQAVPEGAKGPRSETTTDRTGRFQLHGVPAGEYLLVMLDPSGRPIAAAPVSAVGPGTDVVLALPAPDSLAPAVDEEGDEGTEEERAEDDERSGFAVWVSSPTGATITLVGVATVLAIGAKRLTDDDDDRKDYPTSLSAPLR